MKHALMITLLALALCPMGAAAYQKAEDIEQAKPLVGQDGYAVVAYADGWDTFSRQACQKILAHEAVREALGKTVVLELAVPNVTSKEQAEANKKRFGILNVPNPSQYPAIYLYDQKGRLYSTICIPYKELKKYKSIASCISERKEAGQRRYDLLEQADKAKGVEKAKLLGQAATIPDINQPDKVLNTIKKEDPKDESGYVRRLSHNPWAFAENSAKNKDWEAALAEVEKRLADPAYSPDQKQAMCATAIGLYYRNGSVEHLEAIRRYARQMQELDPDSVLGRSTDIMLREWANGLTLQEGWNSANLPATTNPVEVEGPLPISEPGKYRVNFKWASGSKGLTILAVELYDGKTKVAEDRHKGFTGIKDNKPDYTLNVTAPVKDPHLWISVDMVKSRDSSGSITISRP